MTPIEARLLVGQSRSPERKRLSLDGKTWEPLTEAEQAMVDVSTDKEWMKRQLSEETRGKMRQRYAERMRKAGSGYSTSGVSAHFVDSDFDEDM